MFESKEPARRLAKMLSCPTCCKRPESFFADGTICPTCGRKSSQFLRDIEQAGTRSQTTPASSQIITLTHMYEESQAQLAEAQAQLLKAREALDAITDEDQGTVEYAVVMERVMKALSRPADYSALTRYGQELLNDMADKLLDPVAIRAVRRRADELEGKK